MVRYPTNAAGNRYYESRKNAAEHDERLTSRDAAGELLGVSWSSLADYERGLTKVPVDVVCRMADLYKDPSLLGYNLLNGKFCADTYRHGKQLSKKIAFTCSLVRSSSLAMMTFSSSLNFTSPRSFFA